MVRRLLLGVFLGWCGCAAAAYCLAGVRGVMGSWAAAAICAGPAAVSLLAYRVAEGRGRDAALLALLGGMLFRMVFVLGMGALLHGVVDGFDLLGFVLWLMLLYLVTLAIEVW